MISFRASVITAIAALIIGVSMTGCDELVDPIIGSEKPFTLWGYMNAGADTQKVRVFPIIGEMFLSSRAEIDARVFSTDLVTGERLEWRYRPALFDTLGLGHVFYASFRARHGHPYRLEVIRSDGALSRVEVKVPDQVSVVATLDTMITNIPFTIEGNAPVIVGTKVTYHGINNPPVNAWPPGTSLNPPVEFSAVVKYNDNVRKPRRSPRGWALTVLLVHDFPHVKETFERNCLITEGSPYISLRSVELSFIAADSIWIPPGEMFDPEALIVPGTFSNVENGYGFFGAGQSVHVRWLPPPPMVVYAGFVATAACKDGPEPIPACMSPPAPCIGKNPRDVWDFWLW